MSSQASERNFQDDIIAAMQANGWLLGKGMACRPGYNTLCVSPLTRIQ